LDSRARELGREDVEDELAFTVTNERADKQTKKNRRENEKKKKRTEGIMRRSRERKRTKLTGSTRIRRVGQSSKQGRSTKKEKR
jgi:hypothetical protein